MITLLHLGMVEYDLICIILIFSGILGEEKEFSANWRKIEHCTKNRSILSPCVRTPDLGNNFLASASWHPNSRTCTTLPRLLPAGIRKPSTSGVRLLTRFEEIFTEKAIKRTLNLFLSHSSPNRRTEGWFWRIGKRPMWISSMILRLSLSMSN